VRLSVIIVGDIFDKDESEVYNAVGDLHLDGFTGRRRKLQFLTQ